MVVQSEFKVARWNQSDLESLVTGMSMARASVIFEADGEIEGKFNVEYVIHSINSGNDDPHDAAATYVGYMVFTGSINGKTGSFTLEDKGVYDKSGPASDLFIKPDSGTKDFTGISGKGKYYADGDKMIMKLDLAN